MEVFNMEIRINTLTPELFLDLYQSVGWEPPCIEQVRIALKNSFATFTCYEGETPVGMVRVIGDGGMSFYVKDFAVVPACQGKGVGKCLMQAVECYVNESKPLDWAVSLELISSKEAVAFYKKFGFEERPCDWDGPGMFKMVR
jgi:GNAT superfamily N-acetyltransferase